VKSPGDQLLGAARGALPASVPRSPEALAQAEDAAALAAHGLAQAGSSAQVVSADWLAHLQAGLGAVRSAPLPLASQPEPTTNSAPASSAQLVAAVHALAGFWLAAPLVIAPLAPAGPVQTPLQPRAAHGGSPAPAIRLRHVTPEGGLAAVELVHPDLGVLALEVSLTGNNLSVLATTGSEHAAAAIRARQAALAERLLAQNLKLQTLEVLVLRRRAAQAQARGDKRSAAKQSQRQES